MLIRSKNKMYIVNVENGVVSAEGDGTVTFRAGKIRVVLGEYEITPELALVAYNTLIQFCRSQPVGEDGSCSRCILYQNCPGTSDLLPEDWQEIHYCFLSSTFP